jgi:hypothetical protein
LIHFTENVRWKDPAQAMAHADRVVELAFAHHGYDSWKTSVNDGEHKAGSLHYVDRAVDYRMKHVDKMDTKLAIWSEIRQLLAPLFDVLFEDAGKANEHLHVEYDPDYTNR